MRDVLRTVADFISVLFFGRLPGVKYDVGIIFAEGRVHGSDDSGD